MTIVKIETDENDFLEIEFETDQDAQEFWTLVRMAIRQTNPTNLSARNIQFYRKMS